MKVYINKVEIFQISDLNFYLKALKREEQTKSKESRRKEINIRMDVNKIENIAIIEKINETKLTNS